MKGTGRKALPMAKLEVGDIATVILRDSRFYGKQGRVDVADGGHQPDGPIGLFFPKYYSGLFDHFDKLGLIYFKRNELRKNGRGDPQDVDLRQLCDILFGKSMWSMVLQLDSPLMIGFTKCAGCDKTVVARIMVNNHGTVSEIDVCADHSKYHGRNCDGFPLKKSEEMGVL